MGDIRTWRSYVVFAYGNIGWQVYKPNVQGFQASTNFFANIYTSGYSLVSQLPYLKGNAGTITVSFSQ
jgi:hypothetical protein